MATAIRFPPGLGPVDGRPAPPPPLRHDDTRPLNDAVARALERCPRGMPVQAIDPFVRWATGSTLSEWVRALGTVPRLGDTSAASSPSVTTTAAVGPEPWPQSRAGLLRRLPCVGAVDRIAGLSVVYPAASVDRLREHAPPPTPGQYALCASLAGKASGICGGATVVVVDSIEACRAAVQDMRRRGTAIALDCEGTSIVRPNGISPGVALVQMTPRGGPCYLFDMCRTETTRSGRALMRHGGLGALLSDRSVIKVVHDAREDTRALAAAYRCALVGVFDTQAAHMKAEGGTDGPRPSLNAVLAAHGLGANRHKDAMRAVYPIDLWPWHRRPLPDWMVEYAVCDVARLLDLYDILVVRLLSASLPPPPWGSGHSVTPLRGWTVVVAGDAAVSRAPTAAVTRPSPTLKVASGVAAGKDKERRRRRRAPGSCAVSQ